MAAESILRSSIKWKVFWNSTWKYILFKTVKYVIHVIYFDHSLDFDVQQRNLTMNVVHAF